jgi:hypothetical protein
MAIAQGAQDVVRFSSFILKDQRVSIRWTCFVISRFKAAAVAQKSLMTLSIDAG